MALKCLSVIFRDFVNYSRESINMILQPSWKLLSIHLPIYTEVVGYGHTITLTAEEKESLNQTDYSRGIESDDDEDEYGPEGMTT
jgi:hypothetical protein